MDLDVTLQELKNKLETEAAQLLTKDLQAFFLQYPDAHFEEFASDVSLNPEALKILASHPNPCIREKVAANPQTPNATLFQLALEFPNAYIDNPIWTLWHLSDPNALELAEDILELSRYVKFSHSDSTSDIEIELSEHRRLKFFKSKYFKEISVCLAKDPSIEIRSRLARMRQLEVDTEAFLTLAHDPDPEIRKILAKNYTLESQIIDSMLEDCNAEVLGIIAQRHDLQHEQALRLLASDRPEIMCAVAENPSLPESVYVHFLSCDLNIVGPSLAGNSSIPDAVAFELFKSDQQDIVTTLCRNSGITKELQFQIATSGNYDYQSALSENPKFNDTLLPEIFRTGGKRIVIRLASVAQLPANTLIELSKQGDTDIKKIIAWRLTDGKHPHVTKAHIDIINRLALDPSPSIQDRVYPDSRIQETTFRVIFAKNLPCDQLISLLSNPSLPIRYAVNLMDHPNRVVRTEAMQKTMLILGEMVTKLYLQLSKESEVIGDYVYYSNLGLTKLKKWMSHFCEDEKAHLVFFNHVISHSGVPPTWLDAVIDFETPLRSKIWEMILKRNPRPKGWIFPSAIGDFAYCAVHKGYHLNVQRDLAYSQSPFLRGLVANMRKSDRGILEALAHDASSYVRKCLNDNPSCPDSILSRLSSSSL